MATMGEAGTKSFKMIAERLGELRAACVEGDTTELTELMGRVGLQSLASGAAVRDAKRVKNLYGKCIKERERIAGKTEGENKEVKETTTTKAKEKKLTAEDMLAMINATILRLERISV